MVDCRDGNGRKLGRKQPEGLNRSCEDDWHDFGAEHRERNTVNRRVGQTVCVIMAAIALLAVAGCSGEPLSTREKGTLIGGGAGAATGAIIGAAVGAPGAGAAIGGAIGGIGGFA